MMKYSARSYMMFTQYDSAANKNKWRCWRVRFSSENLFLCTVILQVVNLMQSESIVCLMLLSLSSRLYFKVKKQKRKKRDVPDYRMFVCLCWFLWVCPHGLCWFLLVVSPAWCVPSSGTSRCSTAPGAAWGAAAAAAPWARPASGCTPAPARTAPGPGRTATVRTDCTVQHVHTKTHKHTNLQINILCLLSLDKANHSSFCVECSCHDKCCINNNLPVLNYILNSTNCRHTMQQSHLVEAEDIAFWNHDVWPQSWCAITNYHSKH